MVLDSHCSSSTAKHRTPILDRQTSNADPRASNIEPETSSAEHTPNAECQRTYSMFLMYINVPMHVNVFYDVSTTPSSSPCSLMRFAVSFLKVCCRLNLSRRLFLFHISQHLPTSPRLAMRSSMLHVMQRSPTPYIRRSRFPRSSTFVNMYVRVTSVHRFFYVLGCVLQRHHTPSVHRRLHLIIVVYARPYYLSLCWFHCTYAGPVAINKCLVILQWSFYNCISCWAVNSAASGTILSESSGWNTKSSVTLFCVNPYDTSLRVCVLSSHTM